MLVGTRYATAVLADRYDAVVIGSGLGGLTAAALMARAGKRVLVLERHYTAGGFTHSYRRRGFEWDVGVHYVGDVHKGSSPASRVLEAVTDGSLAWAPMDPAYDRIIVNDDSYDLVAGASHFRDELLRSFPGAGTQIDGYLRLIRAASRSIPAHFAPRYLPSVLGPLVSGLASRLDGNYFGRTTADVLSGVVTDKRLAGVLTGQWGDYGLPPGQSAFGMHAAVAQHYLGGASFPVGGAWRIADSIVPAIEQAGGAVVVNAEVGSVVLRGGTVVGVRLTNGHEVLAPRVISDIGVHNTFTRLLPDEVRASHSDITGRLTQLRPSVAHVALYIGLDGTTEDLGLSTTNLWLYRDYDHDASLGRYLRRPNTDLPLNYLSFPSAKDPAWQERFPGRSTIDAISLAPYEWFTRWKDLPWRKRGAEYEDFKAAFAERMLADVYAHAPLVRGRVAYHELSTPLSTVEFTGHSAGAVYGLEHTPHRFAQTWLRATTPVPGLYLTGQDVLFCGVVSALMSGVVTAAMALGPRGIPLLTSLLGPGVRLPSFPGLPTVRGT
jgi:phytoene dehydrogenase-like protein